MAERGVDPIFSEGEQPMRSAPSRRFIAPDGAVCRVYLTPRERPSGISRTHRALVFETEDGRWIGAVPVVAELRIERLEVRDILALLEFAEHWN
jgi:hypothetical protein